MEIMPVILFAAFVGLVLGLSFYFARQAKSAAGYYAAGGSIHWFVNGIAFAGDYLSAASFLGICGMIATAGYDGFLYSIGYLAGWIVGLFVVAEPMKRLGKYTFTDALDAKLRAVSQGRSVDNILADSVVVTLKQGLTTTPDQGGKKPFYQYRSLDASEANGSLQLSDASFQVAGQREIDGLTLIKLLKDGKISWWNREAGSAPGQFILRETQWVIQKADGTKIINGAAASAENTLRQIGNLEVIRGKTGEEARIPAVGPAEFLSVIGHPESKVKTWKSVKFAEDLDSVSVYVSTLIPGNRILRPGLKFKVEGSFLQKLDFVSLMLALFLGTASLPHILIRYYTVPSPAAARKSTIIAIAAIGAFYVLTLYMGLGAMVNGTINLADNNMSAPLLAKAFGTFLFAMISAIAFATVLGTVSGLIVAASGAVAHDLMDRYLGMNLSEERKVRAGKISAFAIGIVSIFLGIIFEGMNVSFLVGWAFSVAASANLPSIIMLLFWKRTTAEGIIASIVTGVISAMGLILLSPSMYKLYGLDAATAPVPIDNPGVFSIPLSFVALVVVSLLTGSKKEATA